MLKQADCHLVALLISTSLATGSALFASPAWSQSIMEAGGLHAGVAGLGAGFAASQNHGVAIRSTYEVAAQTQQAILAQNKAIEQYLTMGTKYEAKKEWAAAEKCYAFVLQVVNRRDGPGSANGLPALKHLVSVNVAQNKIGEAINFQKTVVAFTERAKKVNSQAVVQSKLDLSNLFIRQNDYTNAEPYLQQSVVMVEKDTAIPKAQRKVTLKTYSTVLRKLKKTSEADAVEATLAAQEQAEETEKAPEKDTQKPLEKPLEKTDQPLVDSKAPAEIK